MKKNNLRKVKCPRCKNEREVFIDTGLYLCKSCENLLMSDFENWNRKQKLNEKVYKDLTK